MATLYFSFIPSLILASLMTHLQSNCQILRVDCATWIRRGCNVQNATGLSIKNLLMPLFLMGCFPLVFQEVKQPLRTKSVKRPIKVRKRPINEGETAHQGHGAGRHFSRLLNGLFSGTLAMVKNGPSKKAH